MSFFDSLTHVTADGSWLGSTRDDARCERLLAELERCAPARTCLVAIAGLIDNDVVLDAARRHPGRFVPIGSINPATFDSEAEIKQRLEAERARLLRNQSRKARECVAARGHSRQFHVFEGDSRA